MSPRQVALIVAFLIPLIFRHVAPFTVIDLAGWIAHGEYFLDHHTLLRHDIFSVLPTTALVYPSWGIDVVYALLYRATSLLGVCLFHSAVMVLILWLIYRESLFKLSNPATLPARLAMYVFWFGTVSIFGDRPSVVALVPLLLAYFEIARISTLSELRVSTIAKLALIQVVWVNIHGSFILLPLMLGWKIVWLGLQERHVLLRERRITRVLVALLIVVSSILMNPFGADVFSYVIELSRGSRERLVSEWEHTTPMAHFPLGVLYWLLVCVVGVELFRRRRGAGTPRRTGTLELSSWQHSVFQLLSSPFFLLLLVGATAIRNAALPFLVLLPALMHEGYLDRVITDPFRIPEMRLVRVRRWFRVGLFAGLLILASPLIKTSGLSDQPVFDSTVAFKISDAVRQSGRTCPIFNSWDIGGFLMLTVPNQIFLDFRTIIYSLEQIETYFKAQRAESGWEDYLAQYGACFAVLNQSAAPRLVAALRTHRDWKLRVEDGENLLFERER